MNSNDMNESIAVMLRNTMKRDGRYESDKELRLGSVDEVTGSQRIWDDISGQELNLEWVKKARAEELKEFKKHGVYTKVPIEECLRDTGNKPIGHRWVDIDKGGRNNPNYISRLVAK